jgi:hypothetical protein
MPPIDHEPLFVAEAPRTVDRIAILQSCYIPWKGYFDLMASVDAFILYDDAQYTERDWRNRNRIKTAQGPCWLTIPYRLHGKPRIWDVEVKDGRWRSQHWETLRCSYRRAPAFLEVAPEIERLYREVPGPSLSLSNRFLLKGIADLLGIYTPMSWSWEYTLEGDRSERLANICLQLGARTYVSGPAARSYLDLEPFQRLGIDVEWFNYEGYLEYPQLYPPFDHHVSVLDLIFSQGSGARDFLLLGR